MLLGQAESGKSTLQKQFQLHYASKTMENELPYWRPVVMFNIITAIRAIIEEIDAEFFSTTSLSNDYDPSDPSPCSSDFITSITIPEVQRARWKTDLSQVRTRLLPLTAIEESLAAELSGGAMISRGRGGYVRAGWQSGVTSRRSRPTEEMIYTERVPGVANLSAKTLAMVQDDIEDLWRHPAVASLIKSRKLTLQESAAL